ncbi:MAG: Pla-1/cef family extracellular lipase [Paraglaciecola sp.]|jgi:Pla-1/cef family extracellular lipase
MKKLLLGLSIALLLGVTGCGGGDSIEELKAQTSTVRPASRILFDPTNSVLPVPTDLLFALAAQTQDGTLEMPDEVADKANGGTVDFGNPSAALGAQDGWSTQQAFTISTSHPDGIELDAASVSTPGAVRLFRGAIGGDLNDADCTTASPLTACKIYEELSFGVDFVSQAVGNDIAIIPTKPFAGSTSYYVLLTNALKANDGQALKGSTTYELVRQSITDLPLATASQLALQGLVNSYEAVLVNQGGVAADSIIYSSTFTTQSTDGIFNTIKALQIGGFAGALAAGANLEQAAAQLPTIVVDASGSLTAFDVLASSLLSPEELLGLQGVGLDSCAGLTAVLADPTSPLFATAAATFAQVGVFCSAQLSYGNINLPYYLSTSAPLSESWNAACTNGLALRGIGAENIPGLIANETVVVGPYNDLCQAASGGQLLDLDISNLGIDDGRHITRYSPIPAPAGRNSDGSETLSVQVTVPDVAIVGLLASLNPSIQAIIKPDAGWPVVILAHGIASKKEDILALSGALSIAGFATVAIDHPLHGSRGFVLEDGSIINTSGGFGGSTTDYFNLASLLTARDNNRQAIADILGLRLGLNALVETSGEVDVDPTSVYLAGQSLGAIIGTSAVSMANTSLAAANPGLEAFDAMYAFKGAGLNVPGGGFAGFLLNSASFGNLVKGSLFAETSTEFQQFLGEYAATNELPISDAIAPAYALFEQALTTEQLAEANSLFNQFAFAAQTLLDSGDPNTYALALAASGTPVYMAEVVGGGANDDGSTALPDQVIPNFVPALSGTEPLAGLIGLQGVSSTTPGNGLVRFISGEHGSLINPTLSVATTLEMQSQIAAFFASTQAGQATIVISDPSVVAN